MRYVLAVVVLVVSLVRPGTPHAVAAAAAPTGLDLAAMAINTIDLDDLDMPGYGYRLSSWMTPEELFGESDDMDIYVDDFGLGWSYSGVLNLTDPDDPELLATLQVVLTLSAFDTATGAADAFDEWTSPEDADAEELTPEIELGDDWRVTYFPDWYEDDEADDGTIEYFLVVDSIVASVAITTWDWEMEEPAELVQEDLEAIAERQYEKIVAGLEGDLDVPNLSQQTISFEDEILDLQVLTDFYQVMDETHVRTVGEDEDFVATEDELIESFGIEYAYEHFVSGLDVEDPAVYVVVREHSSRRLAGDFVDDTIDRLDRSGYYADVEVIEDAETFGDDSIALSYTYEVSADFEVEGVLVVFRIGSTTASIQIDSVAGESLDTLMPLAEAQVACIEDEGCEDLLEFPGS